MALTVGARLGPYDIVAQIGEGGMGQVYRARDTRLNRDVALKVLPDAFANDSDRLARFTREAQTLASLNHPHIAAIYGLEESNGIRALVMELIEGEDLSQRIARGPIPIDEALPIAKQIAEALEAAHEQGIVHRDLKPANIKVRDDGTVKVLDFGLAKLAELGEAAAATGLSPLSMSPTITSPAMMTGVGLLLGTAAYMSPEQARGKTVHKRADIWAFGAVLYEMLTGQRVFAGEDVSDTLANVLKMEPAWERLPEEVPGRIRQVLRACLQKNVKQRIGDVQDVRLALEGAFETTAPQTTAAPPLSASRGRLVWMAAFAIAMLAAIALAIPALRHLSETPLPPPPETRLEIGTPTTDQPASFALSPDGLQIVFVASSDGASRLWLRSLATTTTQPLARTEGATNPFWSPDSRSIGFFAGAALQRLDLGSRAPQTLAPVTIGTGGTWNADGVIVFAPSYTTPLMRVPATGGAAAAVTTLGPQQLGHVGPHFLPDGRRFLFYASGGGPDTTGIYLGALDGSAPTRLTPAASEGSYLPCGWLLWVRTGTQTLVAQRLDLAKAVLVGQPVTVADGVAVDLPPSAVSVAATGLVAYRTGGAASGNSRGWTGRARREAPSATRTRRSVIPACRLTAIAWPWRARGGATWTSGCWTVPARAASRSMRHPTGFMSGRPTAPATARGLRCGKTPFTWSADGRFLLYMSNDPQSNGDLWVVPMVGDRTPAVFLKTPFREADPRFSPDGRWVAYASNESGRMEIYVRPFVPPGASGTTAGAAGGQWQVSTVGGISPAWRPDGKELYYLNPAGAMMAAPITVTGSTLEPGAPVVLFPTRIYYGGTDQQQGMQYDVAPDGRFLINMELDSAAAPTTLIQNWNPEAKK